MVFDSVVRALSRSALTQELIPKLTVGASLLLTGAARLPKALVVSALARAQDEGRSLLVVTATLEEAGRWTALLESMGWPLVHFYPTSESSPYEPFDPEAELVWGQLQVLADLLGLRGAKSLGKPIAIITTERALQPHLPPIEVFETSCIQLCQGAELNLDDLGHTLARLGYERVSSVESEGQWSRRGDIIDLFPVASELPVRLELFGDELEKLREFDPSTQRSLDALETLMLTPTSFAPLIRSALVDRGVDLSVLLSDQDQEQFAEEQSIEGMRRFLGLAFDRPASLLDYLPSNLLVALDEPELCQAHGDRWAEHVSETQPTDLPRIHRGFGASRSALESFAVVELSQLHEDGPAGSPGSSGSIKRLNLAARPVPAIPHQFGKLAETLRQQRESGLATWLISAQPSRSVALLQEHDCPAQFIPNPKDFPAIDKLQNAKVPIGLKYSGLAELEGFVLPTFRIAVVTQTQAGRLQASGPQQTAPR
jgi:transcription-repair coupling factor (superfamily II helicase)